MTYIMSILAPRTSRLPWGNPHWNKYNWNATSLNGNLKRSPSLFTHVKSAQSPRQCRLSQGSVPVKITPEPRASEPQAQKPWVRDCKPSLLCWENNDLYLKFIYHYTEHTFLAAIKRLYYDIWVAPAQQKTLGTRSFHNESADPSIATD
jgi:hypothetical protein